MRSCHNAELYCTMLIIGMRSPCTHCEFLHVILFGALFLILRRLFITMLYFVPYAHVRFILGQKVSFDICKFSISWQKLLCLTIILFVVFLSSYCTYAPVSVVCKYVVVMVSCECIHLVFLSCPFVPLLLFNLVSENFWLRTFDYCRLLHLVLLAIVLVVCRGVSRTRVDIDCAVV